MVWCVVLAAGTRGVEPGRRKGEGSTQVADELALAARSLPMGHATLCQSWDAFFGPFDCAECYTTQALALLTVVRWDFYMTTPPGQRCLPAQRRSRRA